MPIAVACYIAIVMEIASFRCVAHKLPFTRLTKVCYIARNAVTDCLNDLVGSPGANSIDQDSGDEDASEPKRNAGL
jgi:hypothetical protein